MKIQLKESDYIELLESQYPDESFESLRSLGMIDDNNTPFCIYLGRDGYYETEVNNMNLSMGESEYTNYKELNVMTIYVYRGFFKSELVIVIKDEFHGLISRNFSITKLNVSFPFTKDVLEHLTLGKKTAYIYKAEKFNEFLKEYSEFSLDEIAENKGLLIDEN